MKKLTLFGTLLFYFSITQAQITGEFKNFDPKKHSEIEVQVNYYSSIDLEYIPIVTFPDENGNFKIDLPYKNDVDVCFFSVENIIFTMLVVDKGLHITLNAKAKNIIPAFVSGKKSIFSGPDSKATIYFNKISKIKASDYNKSESEIVFHSKDSAHIRSKLLEVAFQKHIVKLDKYIARHPSPYAKIARDDDYASYYSRQLIINWGKPMPDALLNEILTYNPSHSSIYTSDVYIYLYNKLFYGDRDVYDHQTKITIWNLLEPEEREDFGLWFTEMRKKNKREQYDEKLYQSGKSKYLDKYANEVYAVHLAKYLEKIESLPLATKDKLLTGSIPGAEHRTAFIQATKPLLQTEEGKRLYTEIEEQSKEIVAALQVMKVQTDEKLPLGNLEATNDEVSMYVAEHDSLNLMLTAIQQTYPDKVIILDIWGTWCGPCRNDIKASKQKIAELKANNVEVVYLCEGRNSSKSAWMEAVVKMEMTGNQIYMSPSLSSEFITQFKVAGYPSHIFIDTKGSYHIDDDHFIQDLDVDKVVKKYRK